MKTRFFFFITVLLMACNTDYTPKPKAFVKLDFPEKVYEKLDLDCPFVFELPVYSQLLKQENSCSMQLDFPKLNGRLYINYRPLENNLQEHLARSYDRANDSQLIEKRDSIFSIHYFDSNVYGKLYEYNETSGTSAQFYLTDSVNHFFWGILHCNTKIKRRESFRPLKPKEAVSDSLIPIHNFLKQDIQHLIKTFHWKDK